MRVLTRLVPVLLAGCLVPGCMRSEQSSGNVGLGVGKPAPNLSGRDPQGVGVKLSDFRGQVVLVDFWQTH